ncbi:MAG: hypothetical protein JST42_12190 [Bacteroidetes bacterium]|nr:hypothetical protein [Bacteroidota bacterium]
MNFDPGAENWSPYTAMSNDPVTKIDPTGGCTDCPDSRTWDASKLWIDQDGSRWQATSNGWTQIMDYVVVMPTKAASWGFANFPGPALWGSLYNRYIASQTAEVSNLFEQTRASFASKRKIILTGDLLERLKTDLKWSSGKRS